MWKIILFLCFSVGNTLMVLAQTSPTFLSGEDPRPEGKKWVKVEQMSDEFDGDTLDESKWKNTDPARWMGRAPAIFKKDVATVGDGNLKLTVYEMDAPQVINGKTWTHAGGYIGSKTAGQVGYYFEARMKASKTFMSSTFWVINNRSDGTGCDVRVTELDIQECIGQITTTASWAQNKYREMGSNTHSRNAVCAETPEGSKGNHVDLGGAAYDDYHIYAAWWKSPREIQFFLDGKHVYNVVPEADFNLPMYLRMVSETYDWNPVPADGGMKGSAEERTTSYDWVRTWKLEDVATSLEECSFENKLRVYPNPAKNILQIVGLESGNYKVSIVSVQGNCIESFDVDFSGNMKIPVNQLQAGVYFLIFQNEKENRVARFVKR